MDIEKYWDLIDSEVQKLYSVASKAKLKGLDPSLRPEVKIANTLAERIGAMFPQLKIEDYVRELVEKGVEKHKMALLLSDKILELVPDKIKAAELAVRVGLAVTTDCVVSAPIEGIGGVKVKVNQYGGKYLAVYYCGPIRTAGATESAFSIVIADYVRRKLELDLFKPTQSHVRRYAEEINLYRMIRTTQYHARNEEIFYYASKLPVEITGPPTEKVEVSSFRDVPGVETNRVRGGAVLVLNDCLIQKAKKLHKLVVELGLDGWDWLNPSVDKKSAQSGIIEGKGVPIVYPSSKYLRDAVGGRPILSHPSMKGGFRLRYGHARNTGLGAVGVHPAFMVLVENTLALGVQVRTERPGKSAVVMPVETIEAPIVLLKDGTVLRVDTVEKAEEIKHLVKKILFNGDILIGYGEFLENNHVLLPSGITEEWWALKLKDSLEKNVSSISISGEKLKLYVEYPFTYKPTAEEAVELSMKLGIPLHPRYTYHWHDISVGELCTLIDTLSKAEVKSDGAIVKSLSASLKCKKILEKLCIPHRIVDGQVLIEGDEAFILSTVLSQFKRTPKTTSGYDTVSAVNEISPVRIEPKAPVYIGLRMGRPEKAKMRKLKGKVNALFPIGVQKGRSRSFKSAIQSGRIVVEISQRKCPSCGLETPFYSCPQCNVRTEPVKYCSRCGRRLRGDICPIDGGKAVSYRKVALDIKSMVQTASENVKVDVEYERVKGVIGLTSKNKTPERLEKGILRAIHGLCVFKDGTIRFDAINTPLTHFKPAEIGVTVKDLQSLGYTRDYEGRELESEDQLVELMPQDIIIPLSAAEHLVKVSKFVDDLLQKLYGLEPYYNISDPHDLLGQICFTISPHTFMAIACRIIGFTKGSVIMAHPILHAAKRRNCDGDEDSITLGLDVLLNFSKAYLPEDIGGHEDAPILLCTRVDPTEVDDEVYNIENVKNLPLQFYSNTYNYPHPKELRNIIRIVEDSIESGEKFIPIKFTVPVENIHAGPLISRYKIENKMKQKLISHIRICRKIRSVDFKDAVERVIALHFLRDIKGNMKKFFIQGFRCPKCNRSFRRPTLTGLCPSCGVPLLLTVSKGNISKYLDVSEKITSKFKLPPYVSQRIEIVRRELERLFEEYKVTQNYRKTSLEEYV